MKIHEYQAKELFRQFNVKVPEGGQRGVVRFTTPLLGADEWPFICEDDVAVGDRVFIKELSGNTLIVVGQRPGQE